MVRACGVSRPQDNRQLLHVRVSRREVSLRTETGIGHTWILEVPSYIRCISIRARRDLSGDCAQSPYSAMASQLALVAYNAVFGRTMIHRACPAHFLRHFPCQRWRSVEFKVALTLCIAMNWDLGTDYILSGSYWTLLACLASA